jgi:hypothetical protein
MTLEPYNAERLDGLSLRVLDICSRLRTLAQISRQEELPPIDLHDRKALEWIGNFEVWLCTAEGAVNAQITKSQGARRARQTHTARPQ